MNHFTTKWRLLYRSCCSLLGLQDVVWSYSCFVLQLLQCVLYIPFGWPLLSPRQLIITCPDARQWEVCRNETFAAAVSLVSITCIGKHTLMYWQSTRVTWSFSNHFDIRHGIISRWSLSSSWRSAHAQSSLSMRRLSAAAQWLMTTTQFY